MSLYVKKRNGKLEHIDYSKINNRIKYLVLQEPKLHVSYDEIVRDIISTVKNEITTAELDEYSARLCAGKRHIDNEYSILAARIAVSNHHKNTLSSFVETMKLLHDGNFLDVNFMEFLIANADKLEAMIDYSRDYNLDYFGHMTAVKSYLLNNYAISERMQHLYLRVATALHYPSLALIKESYDLLSTGKISHATPTLYNSGTKNGQLASCFLLGMRDSIDEKNGIGALWNSAAKISKRAGGIGICLSNIRGNGSKIRGTNGQSDGIVPLCKVLNDISRYVNQGGKRKGSFAIYLEPWHTDIEAFLELRKNHGNEEDRARDLFTALWIPDIFMRRVVKAFQDDVAVPWSLMCPDYLAPKQGQEQEQGQEQGQEHEQKRRLHELHNEEFDERYEYNEAHGHVTKTIPDIRTLWFAILSSQQETGTPYILYKDSINRKNNQANLGTIRTSNLCAEIVEYSDDSEHAVCNLASIPLHNYCTKDEEFDFDELFRVSCIALRNLDNVIDRSWYPTKETHRSNIRHRPVGLGVQGLADVFIKLRMPFDSEEARKLNRDIFETIYYGCMHASMTLAKERHEIIVSLKSSGFIPEISAGVISNHGIPGFIITSEEYLRDGFYGTYSSYVGSPMHSGKFQYHLWGAYPSDRWDWSHLCAEIAKYGVRNSLTTAVMPTASTAIMQQCTECIEPIKSNIYTRRTLNGEYVIYNTYLQLDLKERGLWTDSIKKKIIECRGSIQTITEIPQDLRDLYKTAFEIKQKVIIDMAADRGPFVDQTQSMNLFFAAPTNSLLTNCFIYGWKAGLKTGIYYLRRQAAVNALQFTVNEKPDETECLTCSA